MASVLFKRFFEIRLLHEYYFVQEDGTSIFDKDRSDWDSTLADKVINSRYNIANDLVIEPTGDCKKLLGDYHMRFVQKPTGCIVGIEVNDRLLKPKIEFSDPIVFQFIVTIKNPSFSIITNGLSGNAAYYFSNRSLQVDRSRNAPTLSNKIANFTKDRIYKMGELARKENTLQIARKTTSSDSKTDWLPLSVQSGQYTYVNAQDVCQFKRKIFQYQPPESIQTITANLFADGNRKPIKKIDLTFNPPSPTALLDFSEDDQGTKLADGLYKLAISYNANAEESEMIYFSDTLAAIRPYALIEISTHEQAGFEILNDDNTVRKDLPVFDILFKSRPTYWRYRSSYRKKLSKPDGYDFLVEKGFDLITVDPRALSADAVSFQRISNGVSTPVFLPNPDAAMIQQADDVFYSDVFVPKV